MKHAVKYVAVVMGMVLALGLIVCCGGCKTLGNDTLDLGPAHIKGDTLARGAELARPGSGQAVKGLFAGSKALFGKNAAEESFDLAAPDTITITDATGKVVQQPITVTRTRVLKPIVKVVNLEAQMAVVDEVEDILADLQAGRTNTVPAEPGNVEDPLAELGGLLNAQ